MVRPTSITLGILALLLSSSTQARTLAEIRSSGTLKLMTEGAYKPFNYFEGKTLTGFDVELGTALAQKMNLKYEWKSAGFDSLLISLGQDRFDLVIASHTITDERARSVDFVNYYCTNGVWVVKQGGEKVKANLKNKTIAAQVGTTNLEFLPKVIPGLPAGNVRSYPKDTDALQSLIAGRVDAWSTDEFVALDAIKSTTAAKLELGGTLYLQRNGMAVKKGNSTLLAAVNTALSSLYTDGTYAKLSQKYFGKDIRCPK